MLQHTTRTATYSSYCNTLPILQLKPYTHTPQCTCQRNTATHSAHCNTLLTLQHTPHTTTYTCTIVHMTKKRCNTLLTPQHTPDTATQSLYCNTIPTHIHNSAHGRDAERICEPCTPPPGINMCACVCTSTWHPPRLLFRKTCCFQGRFSS